MPTSPVKRPSAAGRLGRLLASLRPPSRAGPLPVQTGFPTSLADLVVKNHVRLKNPRRRHRPTAAPPSVVAAVAEPSPPPPQQQQRREASPVQNAAVRPKAKGAAFSIRPELLAAGVAVALALLVIWSKWLVAAATAASVALFWIESVRSPASRRRHRPETPNQDLFCGGRGVVSPIREAESEAETPRSSSADSDDRGSEVSSLADADAMTDLGGGDDDSVTPKTKEKRRSLRKLIAKKLRNGKRSKDKDCTASRDAGGSKHLDAGVNTAGPVKAEPLPAPAADTTPPDAFLPNERSRHGGAFPTAAFIPIVLVGLVAGKLPAVALTVLCAVFFSSVERLPAS
ncbi:hypothetical protein EJB05_00174, partial [Eragrostis curvula]